MSRLKKILYALVAMFGIPVALFLSAFLFTMGNYEVPQTVSDDPSLPRLLLNNTTFHSESFGAENLPVLLVVHGGPGEDYRHLLPLKALSNRYRVVFYDQRGTGLSTRVPPETLTADQAAKDLEAMVEHYSPNRPVVLFGHDWGGVLAAGYAAHHPERVASLILAEPLFLNQKMAADILPVMSQTTGTFILRSLFDSIRALHVNGPDADAKSDFVLSRIRRQDVYWCNQKVPTPAQPIWRGGFTAWRHTTASTVNENRQLKFNLTSGIENYAAPVLFLTSECNTLTGKSFQNRQMRLFKQAHQEIIKGAGHYMVSSQPEEVIKVVSAHLAKVKF